MDQIIIEIIDAAFFQLLGKDTLLVALLLEEHAGQLAGKQKAVAWMALDKSPSHHVLALVAVVHICGIKIHVVIRNKLVHLLPHHVSAEMTKNKFIVRYFFNKPL